MSASGRKRSVTNDIVQSERTAHSIPITIKQQDIADRVGATYQMVNHVI